MNPVAKKRLRRSGIALLGLALLAGAAAGAGVYLAERKMQRKLDIAVQPVPLRDLADTATVARGQYLYASRGCSECHGANGSGRTFIDDPNGLRITGPHIGPGPGSVTAGYQPADWVRSIRHGVNPVGRPLMIMPSEDYNRFTDEDLGALVAYVRSLPPVAQGGAAVVSLPLPVRALYGFGLIQDAAAKIDHRLPPSLPVASAVTREHGAYVANMCLGCHGAKLAGGKIPGGPPDWPPAAPLAGEGSVMARYADADSLARMFRTGKRPDGSAIKVMPFESLGQMSDTDLQALHLYLRSLAAPEKKG